MAVRNVSCAVNCCVTPTKDELEGSEHSPTDMGDGEVERLGPLRKFLMLMKRFRNNANEKKKPSFSSAAEEG